MTIRTLLSVLALLTSFEGGVVYDRWLHRPLTVDGITFTFADNSAPRRPPSKTVPPCIANCEPTQDGGDAVVEPEEETQVQCYGDGSLPCPKSGVIRPYGMHTPDQKRGREPVREAECWWAPFGFNICQKET